MLKIRRTLAATLKAVLAKEPGRYAMGGAHIVPGEGDEPATLEATNGRILLQVPLESVDPEELPASIPEEHRRRDNMDGLASASGGILPAEALEALKGTGSKVSDPFAFFALEPGAGRAAVYCSAKAAGSSATFAHTVAGDARGSYALEEGEYPQTRPVVAPVRERKALVTLDVGYLQALLRALEGAGADAVELSVGSGKDAGRAPVGLQGLSRGPRGNGPGEPVGFGIIMPVTLEKGDL